MFGEMQQKSSGGGFEFNRVPDATGSGKNLAQNGTVTVAVTSYPRMILLLCSYKDYYNYSDAYIYDTKAEKGYYIYIANGTTSFAQISNPSAIFTTISASSVVVKNNINRTRTLGVAVWY